MANMFKSAALYYWGEKTLTLDITRYARQGSTGIYEKNDEPVEEFLTANGFHYYMFETGSCGVARDACNVFPYPFTYTA